MLEELLAGFKAGVKYSDSPIPYITQCSSSPEKSTLSPCPLPIALPSKGTPHHKQRTPVALVVVTISCPRMNAKESSFSSVWD
ncbi:uncharacterized protein LOC144381608 isoform X2 [Halichoerus grypus]